MTNFAINFNNDFFSSVGKDATIGGKNGNGFDALLAKVLQEGINLTNDSTQLQTNNDNATFNLTITENSKVILPSNNSNVITNTTSTQALFMPVISQKAVITPETAEKLAALAVITALNIRIQSNNQDTPVSLKTTSKPEDNIESDIKNISTAGKPIENIIIKLPNEPLQILNTLSKSKTTNTESMISFDNRTDDEVREEIKSTIRQVLNKLNLSPSQPMDQVKVITDSPDIKLREPLFAINDNGTIQIANSTPFSQQVTEPTPVTLQNATNNNSKYEQKIEVIFSNIDAAESANNSPTGLTSHYTGQKVTNLVVNSYTANNSIEHIEPTEFVQTLNTERNINIESTSLNATTVNTSNINVVKKQSNFIPIVPIVNNEVIASPTEINIETILPTNITSSAKSDIVNNDQYLNNVSKEIVNPVIIDSHHPLNTIEDSVINNESVNTELNIAGKIVDKKPYILPLDADNYELINNSIVNTKNSELISSINSLPEDMQNIQDIQINTFSSIVNNTIPNDDNNQTISFDSESTIQKSNIQENDEYINTGTLTTDDKVISNEIPVETKNEHPLVSQLINNTFNQVSTSNTPIENININTGNISQLQHIENSEEINPVISSQISTNQVKSTVSTIVPNIYEDVTEESVAKQPIQINHKFESNVIPSGIIAKPIINENNASNIEKSDIAINKVFTNNISVQTSDVTADSIPAIIPALIPNVQPAVTPTHISNKSTPNENIPVKNQTLLNESTNTVKSQHEYNRNQVTTDTRIKSSNNIPPIVTEKLSSSSNKIEQAVITTSIPVNPNINSQTQLTTNVSSSIPFIKNEYDTSTIISTPSIIKPALNNKEDISVPVILENKAPTSNIAQPKIAVVENEVMPVVQPVATVTAKNMEPVITDNKAPLSNIAQPKIAVVENEVMPVAQSVRTTTVKNTEPVIKENNALTSNIAQPKIAVVENEIMPVVQPVKTATVKNTEPVIKENNALTSNIAQPKIAVVENEVMPVTQPVVTATVKNAEPVITDNKAPTLNIVPPKVAVVENDVMSVVQPVATVTVKNTEPVITDNKAPVSNIAQPKVAVVENEVIPVIQPGIIHNSEEIVISVEKLTQSMTNVQSKTDNTTMMTATPSHTDNAPLDNKIASTTEVITTGKSDSDANTNTTISTQTIASSPVIVSTNKNIENFTEVKSVENNITLKTESINTKSDVKETITTVASPVVEENDNIINTPVTANIIPSLVVTQQVNSQPVIPEKISNIPIILSSNKQQTPVQPTAITVDVPVANGQSKARNNATKASENKLSNNSLQNIIINDNSQIATEAPIVDNKMAVVQRLQQMLNNTLAQAVQIIQTIPIKSQSIQQPMILTSDFLNKAELFTENDNVTMQETQRPILSLDEPIMGIKSGKDFFNHLSSLTDKLIINTPQQEKLTKSAPVISQVIAADNSNTFKTESKEQNTEKNMQLSAILSNNIVNTMQKNDDNNSKVVNVNPSRIIEQIAKNVQPIKKDGKHEIILRLDPPTLGEIRVRISSDQNGIVTANIEAVHSSVRDSLAARVPELRQALQDAGLSLDKCQVSLSNDRSFNNQFTNQSGNGRWQNDNRQQTNSQEAFIPLPDLSPDNTEIKMPETATMNYLV